MKKTCIIITTYNQDDSTIRCIESISDHTKNYEIIWVDNGSGEESIKNVKSILESNNVPYRLISNKINLGFVKGTNQGIKEALRCECDYFAFVNNDIEVYEGWLDTLIGVAEQDEKIGIVGPISSVGTGLQAVNNLPHQYPDIFSDIPKYDNNPKDFSGIIKNRYSGVNKEILTNIAFFCALLRRSAVEDVGLLDEGYGMGYFDDNDYCERLLLGGWKIFIAAEVFVFHNHGKTFKSEFEQTNILRMFNQNKNIFEKKFAKGKFETSVENIDDIGALRLEIKRLREKIDNYKQIFKSDKDITELKMAYEMIQCSRLWKLRTIFFKCKNKLFGRQ